METIDSILSKLTSQEIDVDEACRLLAFWANTYPSNAKAYKKATSALSKLYDHHQIGESVQKKLLKAIQLAAPSEFAEDIDDEEDEDETVIANPIEKEDITIELVDEEDEDATVAINAEPPTIALTPKDLEQAEEEKPNILQPGSILKDRFNLVSVLGEGGMGVVYKAIDMLKVEAKDMNPYVAIKVLSEDFKQHPDAFISLQRETSKAQKLAHPNIATVYDFDRDKDTVYMTMELLEGKPLDDFIKSMPKGGLPIPEALEIIEGLGAGLAYAHENGLVHSDFKPGNAFVLYDGPVKVIDFGIARAAAGSTDAATMAANEDALKAGLSDELNPASSDTTRDTTDTTRGNTTTDAFDAGTLGALTPAYATVEMFEGKAPAPSDDIYALACVAVQLLTGKHPFKKKTAPRAQQDKMTVPVIEGFTKRQQRALEKALEFTREKRTETMEEFLDGIRPRKNYTKQIVFGTLVVLGLIGGFGYKPITNYYEQKEIDQIILTANQGSSTRLLQTLGTLDKYSIEKQNAIKTGIKDKALEIYKARIKEAVDFENRMYEFNTAQRYINEALGYFPDSAAIKDLSASIMDAREQLIADLHASYLEMLLAKKFLPEDSEEDLTDTLQLLKKIAPDDETFNDPRLEYSYFDAATKALDGNTFRTAGIYLDTGRQYTPDSGVYANLNDKLLLAQLDQQLLNQQVSTEENLSSGSGTEENYEKQLDQLRILSMPSPHKSAYYSEFESFFDNTFSRMETGNPELAQQLIKTFAVALPVEKIIGYYDRLSDTQQTSTPDSAGVAESLPAIHFISNQTDMEQLLDHVSGIRLAVANYHNNALTQYNLNMEDAIKPLAQEKRPALIEYYKQFYASLLIPETIRTIDEYQATAEKNYATVLNNLTLLASVENDKRIFKNIAAENRLKDSIKVYNKIADITDDTEFLEFAKSEISRMYATLAESNATEGDFVTAYEYIVKAKEFGATERLDKKERNYRKEISIEEIVAQVTAKDEETEEHLMSEENRQAALKGLKKLRTDYVDDYPFIVDNIADKINNEIIALASTELIKAHKLKDYALSVINSRTIRNVRIRPLPRPSELALRGKIEVSQYRLTAAQNTLKEALEKEPSHYQVKEFRELLDEQLVIAKEKYDRYTKLFDNEKYKQADAALDEAIKYWKDNPAYLKERDFFTRVMAQYKAGGKLCRSDMQGIGKTARGTCHDIAMSIRKPTPTMVVVPPTSRKAEPYAIAKYEISTGELNDFCVATGKCSTVNAIDDELPATNVPTTIIEAYSEWLTRETGFRYEIATHKQWLNAASAGGREGNSDYNCRLRLGTKLIKGQNIVPVKSGANNNWGLINYVGNADEIVSTDNGYALVGGNYTDSISDCKISLEKPFNSSTSTAGFRLVRYLD